MPEQPDEQPGTVPAGTVSLSGGYPHESLQPTWLLSGALARA
ncbi:hypothetical protein ACIRYZ_12905 [Kitasatospora sp. NPDC101155]